MAREDNDPKRLNEVIERLSEENGHWRTAVRESEAIMRKRSSKTDGLSLKHSVKTILDEKDKYEDLSRTYKEKLKRLYKLLLEGKTDIAKSELDIFLFKERN